MGTKTSSLADTSASNKAMEETKKLEQKSSGERGLNEIQNMNIEESMEEGIETDSEYEVSDDESEVEDEDFEERLLILDDAKKLKALAVAYLHPELPVQVDPTACARSYFSRPSAPEQESVEEAEYRQQVLEDAAALKQLAVDYAHPEIGVVTSDPTATARSYFSRPSAPEQESVEEAEYRQQVLEDAAALKQLAVDYAHPEIGVVSTDPTACARSYFSRPSAPQQESVEEAEYRQQVLEDAAALKQLAVDYAHPEIGVVTSDPTACARSYFSRPSAPEQEAGKVEPPKACSSQPTKTVIVSKGKVPSLNSTSVKKLDSSKSTDIVRSLSSVQLFGLDGEGDASY